VHEDLLEAVSLVPTRVFIVNFVFHPSGFPLAVMGGDVREAHREICRVHAEHFVRDVEAPYDAVLVSAGGAPRDGNLIQAHKALAHAEGALREGGALVLLARCAEGWGHEDLPFWFGRKAEAMKGLSQETGRKYVQTAYSLQEKARRFRAAIVSELPPGPLTKAGFTPLASPSEAASFLAGELGGDFRGLVLPDSTCLLRKAW
jgi:nickel-dependent lactate racemase